MLNPHRPPHIYLNNIIYFITARTIDKKYYLNSTFKKKTFLKALGNLLNEFDFICYAYIVLGNHYHLLIKTSLGKYLPAFINKLHIKTSIFLNKLDATPGRKIWYQYWDRCPRSRDDFYAWFNYIHLNPIKHYNLKLNQEIFYTKNKEVFINENNIDQLIELLGQYEFSSFNSIIKMKGKKWMREVWINNPIPLDFWNLDI